MNKLFSVEAFELGKRNITATIQKSGDEDGFQDVRVTRTSFESWLDRTGRLAIDNGMLYSDESAGIKNEPVIESRTYQEYYLSPEEVHEDLYTYIVLNNADKVFNGALSGMQSICEEFVN